MRNHERDLDILRDRKKKDCEWLRQQKRMRKSVKLQYKGRGRLRLWIVEKVKGKDWERVMNHIIMSENDCENARKRFRKCKKRMSKQDNSHKKQREIGRRRMIKS